MPVSKHDPRQGLDLHVLQRRALRIGEASDLVGREVDVPPQVIGDLGDSAIDVLSTHHKALGGPAVKALGVAPDRDLAFTLHVEQDLAHNIPDLGIGCQRLVRGGLEMRDHGGVALGVAPRGWEQGSKIQSLGQVTST